MIKFFLSFLLFSTSLFAQSTNPENFDIGSPDTQSIWIDINNGNDSNSGNSETLALRTITAAWNRIPTNAALSQGYHLKIKAGNYPEDTLPNYWENRIGTLNSPIILEAIDGVGTVIFGGDINAFNIHYFYLIGISIYANGDSFHCEQCNTTLLRKVTFDGGNREAHETIKINQSQNFYLENSIIRGADDNAIDLVAVQNGHIINNAISNANDWCIYVKGGSAYFTVAGNEIFDCGTGGFTAGQGTGLEFMESPWLHYEAYDIKVFNNIIHHTEGAGLGVNGGYNILMSYNTLYHVGIRSHLIEFVFGERSCDGNNTACNNRVALGAWGPNSNLIAPQPIPNKNIFFYNNIIQNPPGVESQWQHLAIYGPRTALLGTNLINPVESDQNLVIKNNIIWNGTGDLPLGIGGSDACQNSNPTCNESQLTNDNFINSLEPEFINPTTLDFRPVAESSLFSIPPIALPSFAGTDRIASPLAPLGNLNNQIALDKGFNTRTTLGTIGAYAFSDSALDPDLPPDAENPAVLSVSDLRISKRRVLRNETVRISCRVSGGNVNRVWLTLNNTNSKELRLRNNRYRLKLRLKRKGRYNLQINATDSDNLTELNAGILTVIKVILKGNL